MGQVYGHLDTGEGNQLKTLGLESGSQISEFYNDFIIIDNFLSEGDILSV